MFQLALATIRNNINQINAFLEISGNGCTQTMEVMKQQLRQPLGYLFCGFVGKLST